MNDMYEKYMDQALVLARKAFELSEVPIGAIIVDDKGQCIGTGYNSVEQYKTQTSHAELKALYQAAQKKGDWRLKDCSLFVTLEPCTMCFAAICLSRIDTVIFGATSPLFGYKNNLDCFIRPMMSEVKVIAGIRQEACAQLLKQFFDKARLKD